MSVQTIQLDTHGVVLDIVVSDEGTVFMTGLHAAGDGAPAPVPRMQPLVEVMAIGHGHMLSNTRFTHTAIGRRLQYAGHGFSNDHGFTTLSITMVDPVTAITATAIFRGKPGVAALQTWVELANNGDSEVILQTVSSLSSGAFLDAGEDISETSLFRARSEWCAESRWDEIPLHGRDGLPDIDTDVHDHDARGALVTTSKSTWSSGEYLPTGVLANARTGRSWAWQIEHNGAWHWEVDSQRTGENGLTLLITGPNDLDHQWTRRLLPGDSFTTVPVSVAVSNDGFEGAIAALTDQRRAIRRSRPVDETLPLIFNDYMNTLMGNPTTAKLLPLIDAAAASGAEYFCIDAGWYDDGGAWWDSVGEWAPSSVRFPGGGLAAVLDHIREKGMKPGLWLEPEVIGVRSAVADRLPDSAFLQRYGQRVVEHLRFHLDFRSADARGHLDSVIDTLVRDFGIRYFKLDYNITPGAGTDLNVLSVGDGLLEHNRAHLKWLDGVLDRHPGVIFENCASGGMRMDYAMMSRLDLQSTSDQQDHRLYAAIAASAPASLLPEQAGNWAVPQPTMSDEESAFALVNGMLGRLYLSGHLDQMSTDQQAVVAEATTVYKQYRGQLATSAPFWPLGLPGWFDDTIALGLHAADGDLIAVWNRGPIQDLALPLGQHAIGAAVETIFPVHLPSWNPTISATGSLLLAPNAPMSARLFRVRRGTQQSHLATQSHQ
jgi:alpha-galactosidase